LTHYQQSSIIRKEINESYKVLKEQYPVLKYQNFWGFAIFIVSIAACGLSSYLWLTNTLPTWAMVVINAFFFGVLHELEHDLIHWMYFKTNKVVHHLMLFVVWMLRPLTINPWIRRQLHYHHHKYSGTLHDVEERGVTNGEKWSIKRLILTADLVVGGMFRAHRLFADIQKEVAAGNLNIDLGKRLKKWAITGLIPVTIAAHVLVYLLFADLLLDSLNTNFQTEFVLPQILKTFLAYCNPIIYIIIVPNLIRQFSLHFITSNLHYFGDVEHGNVIEQTQVLTKWWTFPMQLFCFFFGWTHAIHHFVVNETFYVRHIARKKAHKIMKKYGVRFNDMGTFFRANRFKKSN
jgi:hypothetical protein